MKKTIWLLVLNIVIGGICQAQLPERNAVNIEKYREICKKHIYKEMKGMYRQAGGSLHFPFLAQEVVSIWICYGIGTRGSVM